MLAPCSPCPPALAGGEKKKLPLAYAFAIFATFCEKNELTTRSPANPGHPVHPVKILLASLFCAFLCCLWPKVSFFRGISRIS